MEWNLEPMSQEELRLLEQRKGKKIATKKKPKRKKSSVTYRKMTEEEKAQARMDREYYKNWSNSIRMMRAKSQRLADINQRIYS